MANDSGNIRFAPNGSLSMAPAPDGTSGGTVLPITVGDGMTAPVGYKAFGYVTDSGVTLTPTISTDPVNVWQSAVPVLYNVKDASFSIKATLAEVNKLTSELFFGAPWVKQVGTDGKPDIYRLDLSSTPNLTEISLVVDWNDKAIHYRCVMPRVMISDRGAITLQRTTAQQFELTFEALDFSGNLGYVLTDDPNVADIALAP